MDSVTRRFTKLFKRGEQEEDAGLNSGTGFASKYKWLVVVDSVAGGDVLKWNQVFELPIYEFFNYATYIFEKRDHERFEVNRQMNEAKRR